MMELLTEYQQLLYWIGGLLLLLLILFFVFRSFGGRVRGRRGGRLGISEYHEIDKTRRLVLIRRDETEHLLLIGGTQDLVIESGINEMDDAGRSYIPQQRMAPPPPHVEPPLAPPQQTRPPPRPAVFGNRPPRPPGPPE